MRQNTESRPVYVHYPYSSLFAEHRGGQTQIAADGLPVRRHLRTLFVVNGGRRDPLSVRTIRVHAKYLAVSTDYGCEIDLVNVGMRSMRCRQRNHQHAEEGSLHAEVTGAPLVGHTIEKLQPHRLLLAWPGLYQTLRYSARGVSARGGLFNEGWHIPITTLSVNSGGATGRSGGNAGWSRRTQSNTGSQSGTTSNSRPDDRIPSPPCSGSPGCSGPILQSFCEVSGDTGGSPGPAPEMVGYPT